MTVHSRLWFAYYMNDQFDRADGLGAARHRHCLTSAMRSTSQPSVIRIRSANPVSARFAVVLDAVRSPTGKTIPAHTGTRRGQISIASTRGARVRAIRFLQRLLMAYARSPARCRASQKPHHCPTYIA